MEEKWANPSVIGFLLALVALAFVDRGVAVWASHLPGGIVDAALFVTAFGVSTYMFAVSGTVALWAFLARQGTRDARLRERWTRVAHAAVFFFAAIAASGIAVQTIKHVVGRARPTLLEAVGSFAFHPLSWPNSYASFPSGHTTSAFAAATALSLLAPRWRVPWLAAATAIALSRVVVGQHYPTDILAGAALGTVVTMAVARDFLARGLHLRLSHLEDSRHGP